MKFGGESRKLFDSAFQIDELHRHNQNLVGTLHKGVPTVFYRHENCCKSAQRKVSRRKNGSKPRTKAIKQLVKKYRKLQNFY